MSGRQNEKSHPRPEKAPNGINAAAINGRVGSVQIETWKSSLRRHRLRENISPCTYSRTSYSVLASPALSMWSQHLFCAGSINDVQCGLTMQGSKA